MEQRSAAQQHIEHSHSVDQGGNVDGVKHTQTPLLLCRLCGRLILVPCCQVAWKVVEGEYEGIVAMEGEAELVEFRAETE